MSVYRNFEDSKRIVIFYYLPLFCQVASLYNMLFIYVGIRYLYYIVYLFAVAGLLLCKNHSKYLNPVSAKLAFLYIAIVFLLFPIHIYLSGNMAVSVIGMLTYISPILFWFLYFLKGGAYYLEIMYALRYHVLIVALLAFLQYLSSPTLWGVISLESMLLEEASKTDLSQYSLFFRASSILGSPQYLGMFMGLYSILFYSICKKNAFNYILFFIFIIAALLSGSKSCIMILLLFFLYQILFHGYFFRGIVFFSIAFILIFLFFKELPIITRVKDLEYLLDGEQERTSIYIYFLSRVNLIGNGMGTIQNILGTNASSRVAESYLLQLLYELGIIPFVIFMSIIIKKMLSKPFFIYSVILLFCLVIVHCFNGFVFFVFWGILFSNIPISSNLWGVKSDK